MMNLPQGLVNDELILVVPNFPDSSNCVEINFSRSTHFKLVCQIPGEGPA